MTVLNAGWFGGLGVGVVPKRPMDSARMRVPKGHKVKAGRKPGLVFADGRLDMHLKPPRFRPNLPPRRLLFSRLLQVVGDAVLVSVPFPYAREDSPGQDGGEAFGERQRG
jgi:hypothetical protein